jgi:hypothetical protein
LVLDDFILATENNADACFNYPTAAIRPKNHKVVASFELLHASSTVNADDLAIHPVTVLGSEEADNAGDIYWLANTVVRGPSASELIDLVVAELITSWDVLAADGMVHIGLDATGCDTVDSDLLLASICAIVSSLVKLIAHEWTYR